MSEAATQVVRAFKIGNPAGLKAFEIFIVQLSQGCIRRSSETGAYLQLVAHDNGGDGLMIKAVTIVGDNAVHPLLSHQFAQPLMLLPDITQDPGYLSRQRPEEA